MPQFSVRKLALKVLALTVCTLSLFLFSRGSLTAVRVSSEAAQRRLDVSTEAQEGAPLRVISSEIKSSEPRNFNLQVMFQNQSPKEIRAYAITSYTSTEKEQNGYTQFMNLTQRSGAWHPTEVRAVSVSDTRDDAIVSVRLAVDFVEFSDGTKWGPDGQHSGDLLSGQRAGAKAERERIRQLLKGKGRAAVINDLQTEELRDPPTAVRADHSAQWLEGFRSGAGSIRWRLRQALQSRDQGELERNLNKPYDTSEEHP